MTYDESVRYLLALGGELAAPRQPAPAGGARVAKFDLRNITALAQKLGSPHRAVPCAHIAGTNGKGSTAAMLESILRQAGFRTGLYTSPHLERINERIAVNGEPISDADFAAAFTRVLHAIEELLAAGELAAHPTFFECITAMAFDHFAHAQLGFAVYEVGMGGRLDSTNIVVPEVTVITQIDFDHENYLGHSIEAIAGEKAGILKPGVPVVCAAGRPEARAVIARRAAEVGCEFIDPQALYRFEDMDARNGWYRASIVDQQTGWRAPLELGLAGRFQLDNAASSVAAVRALVKKGRQIPDHAIARGIREVRWPGRMERLQRRPAVYLDGAHNPAGAQELRKFWDVNFPARRIILIYGAVRDKAVDEIIGWLFHAVSHVIYTQPRTSRAISAEALAQIAPPYGGRKTEVVPEPEAALARALQLAGPDDVVFATGSLYLVGDLRRWWRARHSPSTISDECKP